MKLNNKILLALALTPAMLLGSCGGGSNTTESKNAEGGDTNSSADAGGTSASSTDTSGAEEIKIWCSETEGVATSFQTIAENWAKENNLNYKFTVTGITEGNQATQMLNDVEAGADIYCFAQDQFARLVQGNALSELGPTASAWVKNNNDDGAVRAAMSGDKVYAYPLTADNGYFMYYDKSVIDESHIGSLEDIIADCEAAKMNFSFKLAGSGWYAASFFMSYDEDGNQLCHSNWTTDNEGNFTGVDDNWFSDNGVIAAKGMQKLVKSDYWNDAEAVTEFSAGTPSAVVVSGTWDSKKAEEALGDNLGVAELPSFTVDGKSYHLGSFSGYKLLGVKPQTDAKKASNLNKLAQVLTGYDAEMERLNSFGWGPSNKEAQESDTFKNNAPLSVLTKQNAYATAQGQIHGSWWSISTAVAPSLKDADGTDDAIKNVLKAYDDSLKGIFQMSDETKRAFTVVGSIASLPDLDWNKNDLPMTEDPTNTWTSAKVTLAEGDEFKCRQGLSWDLSYGRGTGNFVVSADEAGDKKIQLVTTVDADGKVTGGTISLIAA